MQTFSKQKRCPIMYCFWLTKHFITSRIVSSETARKWFSNNIQNRIVKTTTFESIPSFGETTTIFSLIHPESSL